MVTIMLLATYAPTKQSNGSSSHLPFGFASLVLWNSSHVPGASERLGFMTTLEHDLLPWLNDIQPQKAIIV
jgi:hypothetical protein